MRKLFLLLFIAGITSTGSAQLYFKGALKANRFKLHRNLVQYTINKNLSYPLGDSTEDNWSDAFYAIEVLHYKSAWVDGRIDIAAEQLHQRSLPFQRSALELFYGMYPEKYYQQVKLLFMQATDPRIFAMCASYILNSEHGLADHNFLSVETAVFRGKNPGNPILEQLAYQLRQYGKPLEVPPIASLLKKKYLPGSVLVYSFQRKNRDYPGLVLVRDGNGNFIRDSSGNIFHVPQLARSIGNLPPYLTNGNTPEGIFRMKGYDVSRASFIGPTVNVQLTMPFEKSPRHFYGDSTIMDTSWNINYYRNLLPPAFRDYYPIYQSYYAGKAGRREIIIHGTTVNPEFYSKKPFYPLTPTLGCLTSCEFWSEDTGHRTSSDQQKLINALIRAGGANGYAIVVNIDDKNAPVTLNDILPYINKAP